MNFMVNGWNEEFDSKTGERYYVCPECGYIEGSGHSKKCPRWSDSSEDDCEEQPC